MTEGETVRRIRLWLGFFMGGLVLSGITAFPLETETSLLLRATEHLGMGAESGLVMWIGRVHEGLRVTNARYPFLAYGTDWLAFAHLVIAVVFLGPWLDPIRNKWVLTLGLVACVAVIPLALVAGHARGIPAYWRLIDCSFGVMGAIPLLFCLRYVEQIERQALVIPEQRVSQSRVG